MMGIVYKTGYGLATIDINRPSWVKGANSQCRGAKRLTPKNIQYLKSLGLQIESSKKSEPPTSTALVYNAILHLFEQIRYELNGIEIDRSKRVGLTSTMKGWVSHSPTQTELLQNAG